MNKDSGQLYVNAYPEPAKPERIVPAPLRLQEADPSHEGEARRELPLWQRQEIQEVPLSRR